MPSAKPLSMYTPQSTCCAVSADPHKDFHNAEIDNIVISLGVFTGRGVWIEHPSGTDANISQTGKLLSFKKGVIEASPDGPAASALPEEIRLL